MTPAAAYRVQALALPDGCPPHLQVFALQLGPAVRSIRAPHAQRQALRQAVDDAVRVALPSVGATGTATLQHRPGQTPHLPHRPDLRWSIAYAWPLAVWGCGTGQAWGVDIEPVPSGDATLQPHYAEVAALYLDPTVPPALMRSADFGLAFARAWCALEAQLKCAGLALAEATSRPTRWNAHLRCAPLVLPAEWGGYAAALAWCAAEGTSGAISP